MGGFKLGWAKLTVADMKIAQIAYDIARKTEKVIQGKNNCEVEEESKHGMDLLTQKGIEKQKTKDSGYFPTYDSNREK